MKRILLETLTVILSILMVPFFFLIFTGVGTLFGLLYLHFYLAFLTARKDWLEGKRFMYSFSGSIDNHGEPNRVYMSQWRNIDDTRIGDLGYTDPYRG
jgi:hypothetical protein